MTNKMFLGSRTKLQRASNFISELEATLIEYNNNDPITARFNHTKTPSEIEINYKGLTPAAGAILGDAIHNLRTALDLMASELVRINGKSDKDVYFPFAASQSEFADAVKRRNFYKAGDDAVTLLMTYAPYKGGNERLRAIHDLDIEDKHTAILDTEKTMNIQLRANYDILNPNENDISLDGSIIKHHFSPNSPLAGLPVIETLKELVELVENIIDAFAAMVDLRESSKDKS